MSNRAQLRQPLASCLALRPNTLPATLCAASNPLLSLASSELVLPTLYPRLKLLGLSDSLAPELADLLSAVTGLNGERNGVILSNAHQVIALLNQSGIQPVALKGLAYLLDGVFAHAAERYLLDLDFLIPESQIGAAAEALLNATYSQLPITVDPIGPYRHHVPPMFSPTQVRIELHRSVGLGLSARILPAEEILAGSSLRVLPGGLEVRIPAPEHLVTHLVIHSQIWHSYDQRIWAPLRVMDDLVQIARRYTPRQIDWNGIQERFRDAGQDATLKLFLLQVEREFAFPRPIPIVLTPSERLRWVRRRLLNSHPGLRFFDPSFWFLATLSRPFGILRSVLASPGGYRSALRTLSRPRLYRRLLRDIL